MNVLGDSATKARTKIFCSIVMREGEIKHGVLVDRMSVSEQTFRRELSVYLDYYPNIVYDRKTRIFSYNP